VRSLRGFTVHPRLPERLATLQAPAMNLRWSWDERTQDLFRWVDPDGWGASHDPIRLLATDRRRLESLVADRALGSPRSHSRSTSRTGRTLEPHETPSLPGPLSDGGESIGSGAGAGGWPRWFHDWRRGGPMLLAKLSLGRSHVWLAGGI
jgi:hypothetical protein